MTTTDPAASSVADFSAGLRALDAQLQALIERVEATAAQNKLHADRRIERVEAAMTDGDLEAANKQAKYAELCNALAKQALGFAEELRGVIAG